MGKTIPVDQLASEVMKGLEEYAELATDVMKKEVQETGKVVKQQIAPSMFGDNAIDGTIIVKFCSEHSLAGIIGDILEKSPF